jgi:hypothetical protein
MIVLNGTDLEQVGVEDIESLIKSEAFMVDTKWNRSKLIRAQCPVIIFISNVTLLLDVFSSIKSFLTVVSV